MYGDASQIKYKGGTNISSKIKSKKLTLEGYHNLFFQNWRLKSQTSLCLIQLWNLIGLENSSYFIFL